MRVDKRQKGDTIVEVLIAIAVVSSVLGIAYGTMSRNLQIMRTNQERTEASRLGQGQMEMLKALWGSDQQAIISQGNAGFCLDGGALRLLDGGAPAANSENDDLGGYRDECVSSGLYRIGVKGDPTTRVYRVYVRWDALGGTRSQVITAYRLP